MDINNYKKLVEIAQGLLGQPYKYGAIMSEAPDFFDCSGFVKYIFGQIGIDLPRSTIEQALIGDEISLADINPGDLIFVRGTRGHYNSHFPQGIGHVGLYIGDNKVVHAASERLSEKPIIEKGEVLESSLSEFISGWQPLIVIKRINLFPS